MRLGVTDFTAASLGCHNASTGESSYLKPLVAWNTGRAGPGHTPRSISIEPCSLYRIQFASALSGHVWRTRESHGAESQEPGLRAASRASVVVSWSGIPPTRVAGIIPLLYGFSVPDKVVIAVPYNCLRGSGPSDGALAVCLIVRRNPATASRPSELNCNRSDSLEKSWLLSPELILTDGISGAKARLTP